MMVLMLLIAGIGAWLTVGALQARADAAVLVGTLSLLGGGALISVAFAGLYAVTRRGPTSMEVSGEGLVLNYPSRGVGFQTSWQSTRLKLTVYDDRGLGSFYRSGRPRTVKLVLRANWKVSVALTPEALAALLHAARVNGLGVEGEVQTPTSPGPVRRIVIRAARG